VPAQVSVGRLPLAEDEGLSAVVTDLTEHKRTEAELQQYREHLEELVVLRTNQLQSAMEELATANEELRVTTEHLAATNNELVREIAERKLAEEALVRRTSILRGVNRILEAALPAKTEEALGVACLEVAEQITRSRFGFIGELNENGLEDVAISNPGWDACQVTLSSGHGTHEGPFRIHGLYGRVIVDGRPLLTNDPSSHPASIGLPPGHPPLTSFLGVPLIHDGRTVGILAVGNNQDGYTLEDQDALEALSPAVVEAFLRKQAEAALRESEARASSILNAATESIWLFDTELRVLTGNAAAFQRWNMNPSDMIGQSANGFVPPDLAESRKRVFEAVIRDGVPARFEDERADIVFDHSAYPVRNSAGEVTAITVFSRDITERKRAEEALAAAKDKLKHQVYLLQRALIHAQPPVIEGYSTAYAYIPAYEGTEIGGDFLDVFKTEHGRLGILIGDVSGKGIEAAALAATARSTVHAFAFVASSACDALTQANSLLCAQYGSDVQFVTSFLLILDPHTGHLSYCGAGHPPAVISRNNGDVAFLHSSSLPLGVAIGAEYVAGSSRLDPGDRVVLYTDGVSEARYERDLFGTEGIEKVLWTYGRELPDEIVEKLLTAARDWAHGRLRDDTALLVIGRDAPPDA
jgi:PAS domain S-box-containing protein